MIRLLKTTLLIAICITQSGDILAQLSEADYAAMIHRKLGGEREVSVPSGRADLVTSTHAWEIEWADKWKNSIGQALWYGLQTGKLPGIILIMQDRTDFTYAQQLESALTYAGIRDKVEVRVWYGTGWLE